MEKFFVTETFTREVPKFRASNGTVFNSQIDCMEYEAELARDDIKDIETCLGLKNFPPFNGGEFSEWHHYRWFRPNTEEDIERLHASFLDADISKNDIGSWICIETDDSDCFGWAYSLEESISYAKRVLDKLGYEMTVSPKMNT